MRPSCEHQQTRPDVALLLANPILANRGAHNNRHIRRPSVVLSSGLAAPCRRACPFPGKANAQNKWRTPSTHKPPAEDGPTTAIQQASKQAREEGEKEAVFRRRRSCIRDRTSRPERSCCELASTLLCQAADERRIEPPRQQPGLPETRSRRPEDLRVLPFLPTHLQPHWRGSGNDRRSDRHNPRASVHSGTCLLRLPAMHCVPEGEITDFGLPRQETDQVLSPRRPSGSRIGPHALPTVAEVRCTSLGGGGGGATSRKAGFDPPHPRIGRTSGLGGTAPSPVRSVGCLPRPGATRPQWGVLPVGPSFLSFYPRNQGDPTGR